MNRMTVSIYGYGRFGKLWADILAEDFTVKVYSRRGLKNEEVNKNVKITCIEDIYQSDAVFFCVAISSLEQVLIESKQWMSDNCHYFDTCSVKLEPIKWMKNNLPPSGKIIATHPMFGPDSYYNSPDRLPIVMSNISAEEKKFSFWKDYFNSKNMKVEIMTPDEHDKMVAYSQGITHYIGRVLADLNLQPTRINTLGYTKLLEIIQQTCNDSWQLFTDLQRYNPYTKKMRKDLYESIEKIYSKLESI